MDGRGKHGNHDKMDDELKILVRKFIGSLEARESHYSRESNPHKLFLSSGSTKKKLYDQFIHEHPKFNPFVPEYVHNLRYWMFCKIFNEEFNIGIGFPRSDLCHVCELLHKREQVANRENNIEEIEQIQVEQRIHWENADVFYTAMRGAKLTDDSELILCCDFEKNFNLPITGVNKEYFSSHMNIYNFGINNLKTNQSTMFFYSENFARKGSNEVISFFVHYISQHATENTQHLTLFMDNAGGQNKNRFMFAFCQYLAYTRFETVKIIFPVPGHSFMPIDREFAVIEKKRRKLDRAIKPSDWTKFLQCAKEQNPFEIVYVQHSFTDDLQNDGTPVVIVKNYKSALEPLFLSRIPIANIRRIEFRRGIEPQIQIDHRDGLNDSLRMFKRTINAEHLLVAFNTANDCYPPGQFLSVAENSAEAVHDLLRFVDLPNSVTFYESVHP